MAWNETITADDKLGRIWKTLVLTCLTKYRDSVSVLSPCLCLALYAVVSSQELIPPKYSMNLVSLMLRATYLAQPNSLDLNTLAILN